MTRNLVSLAQSRLLVPLRSNNEAVITDDGIVPLCPGLLHGRDELCSFLAEKIREVLIDVNRGILEVSSSHREDEISVLKSQ